MINLAAELQAIEPKVVPSTLNGFEMVRGFGVFSLPFDSGHVLALRVFPQNDFAPYSSIWHQTPDGEWSIYVDGPRHDTACPRYFSSAASQSTFSNIRLEWQQPTDLTVKMDKPGLVWTLSMIEPPEFRLMNVISPRVPERILRARMTLGIMEWIADILFRMGKITLSGVTPNGQFSLLLPLRMYLIAESHAELEERDLGHPTRSKDNPSIGTVLLPSKPVFAVGKGYFEILDPGEVTKGSQRDER